MSDARKRMRDIFAGDGSEHDASDTGSVFSETEPFNCVETVVATNPEPPLAEETREIRERRRMYETIRKQKISGMQYAPDDLRLTLCIVLKPRTMQERIKAMFCEREDKTQSYKEYVCESLSKTSKCYDETWRYEADSKFESAVKSIECSKLFVKVGPEKYETVDAAAVIFRGPKFTLCSGNFSKTFTCFGNTISCSEFRHFVAQFEVERRNLGLPRPGECFLQSLKFQDGKYHITWGNN
tara:strand:- start:352 stop:1071 length:720 start_codon:yes stop_codon:yes gene_type:complete